MANVKDRYAQVTRAAKQANASSFTAPEACDQNAREEARLFNKFRDRARADFSTLRAPTPRRG